MLGEAKVVFSSFGRFLLVVFLAPWLGHGRRVELSLILTDIVYLIALLLNTHGAMQSQATSDPLFYSWPGLLVLAISLPAAFASFGLAFNCVGIHGSQELRFIGGFFHATLYGWAASKYHDVGATATWGFSYVMGAGLYGAFSVMVMSLNNRPRPGAPGAL